MINFVKVDDRFINIKNVDFIRFVEKEVGDNEKEYTIVFERKNSDGTILVVDKIDNLKSYRDADKLIKKIVCYDENCICTN